MSHGYGYHILALDVATRCGWAVGPVGGCPTTGSIDFAGPDGASDNAIFAACLRWLSKFLEPEPRPDMIILEAMLPFDALRGETQVATRDRLAGLHGVIRAVAFCRGIFDVKTVQVQAVRKHFCGSRIAKKDDVVETCRRLGWPIADHNAADAASVWDYACALADPTIGIKRSPLFRGMS